MVEQIRRIFAIKRLSALAGQFVRDCRLCMHVKGGKIVTRPWGETIDCSTRNGVLHFDFLSMGDSFGDTKYILVLKDHATHFCELVVADTADTTTTVEALLAWNSRFGLPELWVSDNGTHFKNEVMEELSRRLRSDHDFTPAYCPWINGSVERVNRDILQVMRVLILEYKISHHDWVYLVPMVQSSINHTPMPSLGNHAPVELFTGLKCPSPLRECFRPKTGEFQQVPPNPKIDAFLSNLRTSIAEMHAAMKDKRLKQRLLNKKKERGENLVNFTVGDYVLRSRVDEKQDNKLLVLWVGPYRVVRADPHSFRVQHLVTGAELDVHASRLKFYSDDSLDVNEELLEQIAAQGIILAVDKLKKHRWNEEIGDYEILVQWKGLESIEDSFEPLRSLIKDVPVLLTQYIETCDQKLQDYWNHLLANNNRPAPTAARASNKRKQRSSPRKTGPKRRAKAQAAPRARAVSPTDKVAGNVEVERLVETNSSISPHRVVQAAEEPISRRTRSQAAGNDISAFRSGQTRKKPTK